MKLIAIAAVLTSAADAFAPARSGSPSRAFALHANKAGIYYSTQTGNTETVASYIAEAAGLDDPVDIGDASDDDIAGIDSIIVGAVSFVRPNMHPAAIADLTGFAISPRGTQTRRPSAPERTGTRGSTRPSPTLMWRGRTWPSSAWATRSLTVT